MNNLLTVPQAAKAVRQTEQNLLYHIQRGSLKAERLGFRWVIKRGDLAKFVAKRAK